MTRDNAAYQTFQPYEPREIVRGFVLLVTGVGPARRKGRALEDAEAALAGWAGLPPQILMPGSSADVVQLPPGSGPQTVRGYLERASAIAGPVLVYLTGHLMPDRRGELHVTLRDSNASSVRYEGLPWAWLAETLRTRDPRETLVIADLTAAADLRAKIAVSPDVLADRLPLWGVLTAPPAHADPAHAFTRTLTAAARRGFEGCPELVDAAMVHPAIAARAQLPDGTVQIVPPPDSALLLVNRLADDRPDRYAPALPGPEGPFAIERPRGRHAARPGVFPDTPAPGPVPRQPLLEPAAGQLRVPVPTLLPGPAMASDARLPVGPATHRAGLEELREAVAHGRFEDALALARDITHDLETRYGFGPEHRDTLDALETWAWLTARAGHTYPAVTLYAETARRSARVHGPGHDMTRAAADAAHALWLQLAEVDQARELGPSVVALRELVLGSGVRARETAAAHLASLAAGPPLEADHADPTRPFFTPDYREHPGNSGPHDPSGGYDRVAYAGHVPGGLAPAEHDFRPSPTEVGPGAPVVVPHAEGAAGRPDSVAGRESRPPAPVAGGPGYSAAQPEREFRPAVPPGGNATPTAGGPGHPAARPDSEFRPAVPELAAGAASAAGGAGHPAEGPGGGAAYEPLPPPPELREALAEVAAIAAAGRHDEALGAADAVVDALAADLGPDHPNTLNVREIRAYLTAEADRVTEAATAYLDIAEARVVARGPDHPDTVAAVDNAHALWLRLHDGDPAVPTLGRRLVLVREAVPGPGGQALLGARERLASLRTVAVARGRADDLAAPSQFDLVDARRHAAARLEPVPPPPVSVPPPPRPLPGNPPPAAAEAPPVPRALTAGEDDRPDVDEGAGPDMPPPTGPTAEQTAVARAGGPAATAARPGAEGDPKPHTTSGAAADGTKQADSASAADRSRRPDSEPSAASATAADGTSQPDSASAAASATATSEARLPDTEPAAASATDADGARQPAAEPAAMSASVPDGAESAGGAAPTGGAPKADSPGSATPGRDSPGSGASGASPSGAHSSVAGPVGADAPVAGPSGTDVAVVRPSGAGSPDSPAAAAASVPSPGPAAPPAEVRNYLDAIKEASASDDHVAALTLAEELTRGVEARHGPAHPYTLNAYEVRAHLTASAGLFATAARQYTALAHRLAEAVDPDAPGARSAADAAQRLWVRLGRSEAARKLGPNIVDLRRRVPGPDGSALDAARDHLNVLTSENVVTSEAD